MRLYDKNNKPRGSIAFYENRQGINLQFSRNSKYFLSFRKMFNEFLNRENLKIVSSEGSSRTHKNHKKYSKKIDGFDVFIKWRNPRTQKIELKPIVQTPNSASQVSKADEHNISLKTTPSAPSKLPTATSLNNNIRRNSDTPLKSMEQLR
jgi:hypothetical protein